MKTSKHKIVLLEDDAFLGTTIQQIFSECGASCKSYHTVKAAEHLLASKGPDVLIADLAIQVGNSSRFSSLQTRSGFMSGMAFIRAAKEKWKKTKFVLITGQPSAEAEEWSKTNGVTYLLKPIARSSFERLLVEQPLRAFVVHGRDAKAIRKIKAVLKQLRIVPVILMEQPSKGKTVIEKFEDVSSQCDCSIVAFSPDDLGNLAGETRSKEKYRVRQNVLFELGYFCSSFRRKSGRVVVIQFGDVEIPSDLAGIVRLDGNASMKELVRTMRGELLS